MTHRILRMTLGVGFGVAFALASVGCTLIAWTAVAAETAKEQRIITVEAEYTGLADHSFALIVSADRVLLAEHPYVVQRLTVAMNERLRAESEANGYVPPLNLLTYIYNNPRWVARPLGEVAKDIGVDRLILVELRDYRLTEPGNQYIWDGSIFATVGVIEPDSLAPDEFVFTKTVRIQYPETDKNYTSDDEGLSGEIVQTILESRFVDRVTWLFYDHEERNKMDY